MTLLHHISCILIEFVVSNLSYQLICSNVMVTFSLAVQIVVEPVIHVSQPDPVFPSDPVEQLPSSKSTDSVQVAAQVQDLKEKLTIVQSRRQEEKARNKELERYKLLYEQMSDYKSKWSTSQSDLHQQLKQARKDAKEAQEAKAVIEEELVELQEAVEMATLDKEMAEERVRDLWCCMRDDVDVTLCVAV